MVLHVARLKAGRPDLSMGRKRPVIVSRALAFNGAVATPFHGVVEVGAASLGANGADAPLPQALSRTGA